MTELIARTQAALRGPIAEALGLFGEEIEVVAVEDGIASVRLAGACASCPAGLPLLIQQLELELKQLVPEIDMIEAVL